MSGHPAAPLPAPVQAYVAQTLEAIGADQPDLRDLVDEILRLGRKCGIAPQQEPPTWRQARTVQELGERL